MKQTLVAILLATSILGAQASSAQSPVPDTEELIGVIEGTKSANHALLFVSVDTRNDGTPDRGYLLEIDDRATRFPDLKGKGIAYWRTGESLTLTLEPDQKETRRRIVFKSKANSGVPTVSRADGDLLITIKAMHRFRPFRPKSHAELVPVQFQRTLSARHRVR